MQCLCPSSNVFRTTAVFFPVLALALHPATTIPMKLPDGVPECRLNKSLWNSVGICAGAALGAAVCFCSTWAADACSRLMGSLGLPEVITSSGMASGAVIGSVLSGLACALASDIDDVGLIKAEAEILEHVSAAIDHDWVCFRAASMTWHVHALRLWDKDATLPPAASDDKAIHLVVVHGHSSGSALFAGAMDHVLRGLEAYQSLSGSDALGARSSVDGSTTQDPIRPSKRTEQSDGTRLWTGAPACVWLIDMPGWGRSPAPDGFTALRTQAEAVAASVEMLYEWMRMQGLRGSNTVLMGHSIGGLVCAHFAHQHPTMLRQLLLVAPAGLLPAAARRVPWTLMMRFVPPQLVARVLGRALYGAYKVVFSVAMPEDRCFADYYYCLAHCTATRGMADRVWAGCVDHDWGLSRVWWRQPSLETVMGIRVPMTLLWGRADALFPAAHAALLHQLRPDVDVYIVDEAGHNPLHDDAPATAAAIVDTIVSFGHHRLAEAPVPGTPHREAGTPLSLRAAAPLLPIPPSSDSEEDSIVVVAITGSRVRVSMLPDDDHLAVTRAALRETHAAAAGSHGQNADAPLPVPLLRRSSSSSLTHRAAVREDWAEAVASAGGGSCRACGARVELRGHRWHCRCASWTFASDSTPEEHARGQRALAAFLTDLHVTATFDACKAAYLRGFIVRSGLPCSLAASGDETASEMPLPLPRAGTALDRVPEHVHGHVFVIASVGD